MATPPSPSTSTHIPAGPAPQSATPVPTPACARHQHVDGPRHCRACPAALCTACVRHPIHGLCPACARAQNLPVWRITWGWLWTLLTDAVITAVPRLHKSALPLVVLLWAAFKSSAVTPEIRMTSQSLSYIADAVLLSLLLGTISTALRGVPATISRVWRALIIQVLLVVGLIVPGMLMWWLSNLLTQTEMLWVVFAVGGMVLWLLLPVMQACAALSALPLHRAAAVPFQAGLRALGMAVVPGVVFSAFGFFSGALGAGDGWWAAWTGALTSSLYLLVQAALAIMAYRFLSDARAAKEAA